MKKKVLLFGLNLLLTVGLLGCKSVDKGDEINSKGVDAIEQRIESLEKEVKEGKDSAFGSKKIELDNPGNIVLKHPEVSDMSKILYQFEDCVVMIDVDVDNLELIYSTESTEDTRLALGVPDEIEEISFAGSMYLKCIDGNVADMYFLPDAFIAKERNYVTDNIFYAEDDISTSAFIDLGTDEHLKICSCEKINGDKEIETKFLRRVKDILSLITIFPNTGVNNTSAISIDGQEFNLLKYPTLEDICSLKLYDALGFNIKESENLLSYGGHGFGAKISDGRMYVEYWTCEPEKEPNFTIETDKVAVKALLEDERGYLSIRYKDYDGMYLVCDGSKNMSVKKSEEEMKKFLEEYFMIVGENK